MSIDSRPTLKEFAAELYEGETDAYGAGLFPSVSPRFAATLGADVYRFPANSERVRSGALRGGN
jgi:hypothetical protein